VDEGHTVFVISWVNPDETLAQKGFEDYMREGPLAALDAIKDATGERTVNAVGYCLGGTLLAATLAYNAAHGDDRIASATYFVTLVDFSDVWRCLSMRNNSRRARSEWMSADISKRTIWRRRLICCARTICSRPLSQKNIRCGRGPLPSL